MMILRLARASPWLSSGAHPFSLFVYLFIVSVAHSLCERRDLSSLMMVLCSVVSLSESEGAISVSLARGEGPKSFFRPHCSPTRCAAVVQSSTRCAQCCRSSRDSRRQGVAQPRSSAAESGMRCDLAAGLTRVALCVPESHRPSCTQTQPPPPPLPPPPRPQPPLPLHRSPYSRRFAASPRSCTRPSTR